MVLNVFFQKSCSAFLVPAFRQCLRQQRLYDRGLSMSKFQRVIGFLDGFFRQMLFQENICENRMPTPRVGVNFHRPLHVRFCFGEFLFPHQRLAQLLLDFRGKERLRGTRAGFSTPRRPHVNKDCRRFRTEGPKFFGNTFITGCSHLNGICACSYSFELYVAAQRCSLREDLPSSSKQSNHCWHFDRTAVRPPQMNVDIARTVSVRCTGVRRGRLRENRIGERRSREEKQENKILRDAEDLSEKPAQVCATSCATFLDEPQCPDTCQNDQRPHPLELHS